MAPPTRPRTIPIPVQMAKLDQTGSWPFLCRNAAAAGKATTAAARCCTIAEAMTNPECGYAVADSCRMTNTVLGKKSRSHPARLNAHVPPRASLTPIARIWLTCPCSRWLTGRYLSRLPNRNAALLPQTDCFNSRVRLVIGDDSQYREEPRQH